MRETSKASQFRSREFFEKYLCGRVIDIGAGNDPVCHAAEIFDVADGDANRIDEFRTIEAYDSVYSSHCLEHMNDPQDALNRWWKLVKPGGYLIVVVPDEELYEQGFWPSIFNTDHKASFRHRYSSTNPASFDLEEIVATLPGSRIVSVERQIINYNLKLGSVPR
jgi:SAM-dependent methyltransferase